MRLPLLVSVPHAGLAVPAEVRANCALTAGELAADGDEGAREIYAFEDDVQAFVTTEIARAVVDMNRPEDDRGRDGVVKTHTCLDVPVWRRPLSDDDVELLLARHHRPYHAALRGRAASGVVLGVDCHTMLAVGPPIGPLAGQERPRICLSNVDGASCPTGWLRRMASCLEAAFGDEVSVNHPFRGGFITRCHSAELPWIQLELSRAPFLTDEAKGRRVLDAFRRFCESVSR